MATADERGWTQIREEAGLATFSSLVFISTIKSDIFCSDLFFEKYSGCKSVLKVWALNYLTFSE